MKAGDYIDQILEAQGGQPPYQWEVRDLPATLTCRKWGSICGVLAPQQTNSPQVSLLVRDSLKSAATRTVPLKIEKVRDTLVSLGFRQRSSNIFQEPPVIGESELAIIDGGVFLPGFQPCQLREHWLKVLQANGLPISPARAKSSWPAGTMHLHTYLINRFEVTNAEYAEFVRDAAYPAPGHWPQQEPPQGKENHPVTHVCLADVQAFCEYKTQKAQHNNVDIVYHIPTHWQWEKAAKGPYNEGNDPAQPNGPGRMYPWGDQWADGCCNDLTAKLGGTSDVKDFANTASPFGVCDMAGNVSEWVDAGLPEDEQQPCYRHIRGASWRAHGALWGLSFYYGDPLVDQRYSADNIGFRCVIELPGKEPPAQALVPLGNDMFIDGDDRKIFVGPFYMARLAVSNDEYRQFKPAHSYKQRDRWRPVTRVGYEDALDFCKWKSLQDGRHYRLPTFQQWQRACRGSEGRRYPWGGQYSRYLCNSRESAWGRTVDVFALWQGASPDGIYNLCGNTFEWLYEGLSVGGSYRADCQRCGAPPFTRMDTCSKGTTEIGFRYIALGERNS